MFIHRRAREQYPPVDMGGDRLMFTQSDMDPSNFGVDQHGETVLMDFGEIGFLPETFVAFTMFSNKWHASIALALNLSYSSGGTMGRLSGCLVMAANTKLGASTYTRT